MSRPDTVDLLQFLATELDAALNGDKRGADRTMGFTLLTFKFGAKDPSMVNYVSNASRPDMINALKEFIARAEGRIQESETKQ